MEDAAAKALVTVYGPLGILAAVAMAAAFRLYRDLLHLKREHARETKELQERYVTKAETWMEKYHELAKSLNDVLDSISSRYERR